MNNNKKLSGWGRYPWIESKTVSFETTPKLKSCLAATEGWIVRGMGRSYGDCALNHQVILSHRFNKILDFDPIAGRVTCEAGVTLAELIDIFLPRGWFLAVTPGTKLISVGGAIASDVHGKNHHLAGCFSTCLDVLELMLPDGRILQCSKTKNRSLFLATCGGMGLTGVILTASFRLQPVASAYIHETMTCFRNLAEAFDFFEKYHAKTYSVAWIDCLATAKKKGRGILFTGRHAAKHRRFPTHVRPFSVPLRIPGCFLNRYSLSMFNQLYYHTHSRQPENRLVTLDAFFYPLDRISHWNRLYGRDGFTQYQCVLPKEGSYRGVQEIIKRSGIAGFGPFLAVLKLFGPQNKNYLSFPMEGYTLALDFKIQPRLFTFLDELDRIVLDHGGRLYLSKDVRMKSTVFQKGYPMISQFAQIRRQYDLKDKFSSLQSKRLGV